MSTEPSVLVMDLGGVTCRWLPDRRLAELAQIAGLPASTIDQQVFESGFDDAGERGRFTLEEFTAQLLDILDLPHEPEMGDAVRAAWAQAFEPMAPVIKLISAAPCRTALFTNNGPLLEAALDEELGHVGKVFDQLVFSWRLGATKPEPAAFERATALLGVDPGEIFFVDDSAANASAATEAGWQAHRFTSALDLQAALADVGLTGSN